MYSTCILQIRVFRQMYRQEFKTALSTSPLLPVLLFSLRIGDAPLSLPPVPSVLSVPLCETIPRTPSDLH